MQGSHRGRALGRVVGARMLVALGMGGCGRIGYERPDATAMDVQAPIDIAAPIDTVPPIDRVVPTDTVACTVVSTTSPCTALSALPVIPVIDGVLECSLTLHTVTPTGWTASTPIPSGYQARVAFAWRPDGVYAFVEVTDPTRSPASASLQSFCGDGVEIYLDGDGVYQASGHFDNPGTSQIVVVAPADDTTPGTRVEVFRDEALQHTSSHGIAVPTPTGYVVEVFATASDLDLATWTLSATQHIGLDMALNIADGPIDGGACGNRIGQYFFHIDASPSGWCVTPELPFCDSIAFCTPTLEP